MISMEELLNHKYTLSTLATDVQQNLEVLRHRVNIIRAQWNKPMIVTSGYRSIEDHLRIYAAKGITDKSKIPMQSRHLTGRAVDVADEGLVLTAWLRANPKILEDAYLWCEDGNTNWVHFQTVMPLSGNRWFKP